LISRTLWFSIGNPPPIDTWWSDDGATWIRAGDAPPDSLAALIEAPECLLAVTFSDGGGFTVWTADKQ
jgi:hypothetical protein